MKSVLIKIAVNALAIWVAAAVINGVHVGGSGGKKVLTLLVVGAIFGVLNAFIKPVIKLFSLPAIVLTLGLFVFIINAFMLQLVSWLSDSLNIEFHIDHFFWTAVLAAIVVSFVSMVLHLILPDGE